MTSFSEKVKDYFKRTDIVLWIISFVMSAFSLTLLLSVSRTSHFSYFKTQFVAIALGYLGAYFITKSDYRFLASKWYWVAGICISLILCTLIFGKAVTGNSGVDARAWLVLPGGITFQPSELAKIGFMITFAKHLDYLKTNDKIKSFKSVCLLAVHALIPMILTHIQGDDGAAAIFFFMFLFMSFSAGVQLRYFGLILTLIVLSVPILWNYVFAEYQKQRILSQFNPESDPLGMGFQQMQGKLSIGSGGLWGRGLFSGPRVGYNAVPIQESDFIFSVAGEELGFIGCVVVILILFALLFRTLQIANLSCDGLGAYMCFGFFGLIASQTIFNLGMCLSILPVMGVTLPFFSAGGSSSACFYLGIGIVQNVFIQRNDKDVNEALRR